MNRLNSAKDAATNARDSLTHANNRFDVGGMDIPQYERELTRCIGLITRAISEVNKYVAEQAQLQLELPS